MVLLSVGNIAGMPNPHGSWVGYLLGTGMGSIKGYPYPYPVPAIGFGRGWHGLWRNCAELSTVATPTTVTTGNFNCTAINFELYLASSLLYGFQQAHIDKATDKTYR